MLLLVGGCGRVAFDPRSDARADGESTPIFPAQVCDAVRTPAASGSDFDVVATARLDGSGLAIAALRVGGEVTATRTNAAREPIDNVQWSSVSALGAIVDTGQLLALAYSSENVVRFGHTSYAVEEPMPRTGTGNAVLGRDCLMRAHTGGQLIHALGTGSFVTLRYINPDGSTASQEAVYDTGMPVRELACADATTHVHPGWRHDDGSITGGVFDATPATPTFNTTVVLQPGTQMRATVGDLGIDDGMHIYVTPTGAIAVQYDALVPGPEQILSPTGTAPRIGYDGTRFWAAWLDLRTGEQRLRIGHLASTGGITDVELPILPAGEESFELVRDGSRVDLVVRESDALSILQLCP